MTECHRPRDVVAVGSGPSKSFWTSRSSSSLGSSDPLDGLAVEAPSTHAIDAWHDLADPASTSHFAPGHEPRLASFGLNRGGLCATSPDAAGRGASE